MKRGGYFAIVAQLPRLMDATETVHYVKLERILKTLRKDFGLRPVEEKHGSTLYDREDVDAAINRMKAAAVEKPEGAE